MISAWYKKLLNNQILLFTPPTSLLLPIRNTTIIDPQRLIYLAKVSPKKLEDNGKESFWLQTTNIGDAKTLYKCQEVGLMKKNHYL